jgi:hypothetical protein
MASNNYIVRDIVHYIHDENEYRTRRSFSDVFDKLKANFWIFFIIVGLSCGVGYCAVYLPSLVESQQAKSESTFDDESAGGMRSKFNHMSAEQKAQIMQQMGGGTGMGEMKGKGEDGR